MASWTHLCTWSAACKSTCLLWTAKRKCEGSSVSPVTILVHYQWPVTEWPDHSVWFDHSEVGCKRVSQSHLFFSTGNGTPGTSKLCLSSRRSHVKFLPSLSRRLLWHCHGRRSRGAFPGLQVRRSASPPQPIRGREEEVGASPVFPGSNGNLIEGRGSGGNRLVLTQEFNLWIINCDSQICPWPGSVSQLLTDRKCWSWTRLQLTACFDWRQQAWWRSFVHSEVFLLLFAGKCFFLFGFFFFFFPNCSRLTCHWNSC